MAEPQTPVIVFDDSMKASRRFWLDRLSDRPVPASLPLDYDRTSDFRRARTDLVVPPAIAARMAALSGGSPFLVFVTFLSALSVWLSRATGARRLAIGSPSLNEAADGTVVLVIDLDPALGLRDLLLRARADAIESYSHQEYPLAYLARDLALAPADRLFRIMVVLEGLHGGVPAGDSDVSIVLRQSQSALTAAIDFDASVLRVATIETFWAQLMTVLEHGLADLDAPAGQIPLADERELQRAAIALNDTAENFPADCCLHELFERQVALAPTQLAVVSEQGETLSYGELNARANQLARYLRHAGARPNERVGVLLGRSSDVPVALLAIAKAGAAYVPIDPSYPVARIASMIDDAAMRLVVTTREWARTVDAASARLVLIDEHAEEIAAEDSANLGPAARPDDLACMIYTSGSSGMPKGVLLDHRGRVNNFTDFNRRFRIGPGDRLLAISSLSFDMSAYDVFGVLASGAAIVIPDRANEKSAAAWAALIANAGVTVWHSAPVLLDLLMREIEGSGAPVAGALRVVLLGGDWIPVSLPDRVRARFPRATIVSLGGATEASMDSTIYVVGDVDARWRSIPYGRPMANQRAYVLTSDMGIAPIGLPGELYLGGAGVAWGYWRRPAQTAEKFVPHPFGAPGERLYRTGDLARLVPDGQLELLGRTDHQIKVRGLRIEPTEIEAALKAHPSVLRCLVAARPDATGEKVLVAYIVARPGRSVVASALRRFIAERLPAFMVPSHIKTIDEIPLTPNGKVDRRHLPAPDDAPHDRSRTYVAPRSDLERAIAERWSAVFGIEPIGIDDNFFDLGGDSLKAMKACQLPDRQVPIVGLYKHPTIRQLVEQVLVSGWVPGSVLHAIRPATPETTRTLVCFPYGGGSPIVFQPMADVLPRDWAIYALDPPGRDPARPGEALWSIEDTAAACVEGLSRTIRTPIVVYGHCGGVAMATEVARLLEAKGQPPLAVLLGAAIPQRDGDQAGLLDPLERLSDAEAHALLKQLGGFEEIDPAYLSSIMRAFRHDGRCAHQYFFAPERRHASSRVRTPLMCIVGSTDPLTPRYDESFGEWAGFYESVELRVIENAGHYFIKSHAAQLAAIIGERTRASSAAVHS